MNNKALFFFMGFYILFLLSCQQPKNISQAKTDIQQYLDTRYEKIFRIDGIEKDYNPDLFHEQWGFKVWLTDTLGLKFGPVFMQENEVQGWIPFKGSDILEEYQKVKPRE